MVAPVVAGALISGAIAAGTAAGTGIAARRNRKKVQRQQRRIADAERERDTAAAMGIARSATGVSPALAQRQALLALESSGPQRTAAALQQNLAARQMAMQEQSARERRIGAATSAIGAGVSQAIAASAQGQASGNPQALRAATQATSSAPPAPAASGPGASMAANTAVTSAAQASQPRGAEMLAPARPPAASVTGAEALAAPGTMSFEEANRIAPDNFEREIAARPTFTGRGSVAALPSTLSPAQQQALAESEEQRLDFEGRMHDRALEADERRARAARAARQIRDAENDIRPQPDPATSTASGTSGPSGSDALPAEGIQSPDVQPLVNTLRIVPRNTAEAQSQLEEAVATGDRRTALILARATRPNATREQIIGLVNDMYRMARGQNAGR